MTRDRQSGVSLVELLAGTAIGLIVVAAGAAALAANQVAARRVQIEARLMQDLRAAAEMVGRDLRRAGHWAAAASGVRLGDAVGAANPHAAITPASAASSAVALSFSTDAGIADSVDDSERFAFRLRAGAIEIQLGARNWQALSDPQTLVVTSFTVVPRVDEVDLSTFCAAPCAAGSLTCPPHQQIRTYAITIVGRSAADPGLVRSLRSSVRVRNDIVVGSCET
jgi:type IV pilus assembly protein PilW